LAIDPVRVGIIGTTAYAEIHMANVVAHPNAVFRAVAGRDHGRTSAIAQRYGAELVFDGYEALIRSDEIDAVLILAPDALHEQIALESFAAGLHVLCEKPLATTPEAARRMADAARESGLVNMSYFALRTSPHHHLVKQLLEQGAIGNVRSASFSLAHGLFRSPEYNWRFDASRGGGVIADLGCYLFDQALWYIGGIASVTADGATFVSRPNHDGGEYTPAPDSAVGAIHFDSGAHATFEVSVVAHVGEGFQRNTVQIQGDRGRLELDHTFAAASVRILRDGEQGYTTVELPDGFEAPSGDGEFIDAILHGGDVRPSFEDGWRVQQVVAAAEAAAQSSTWVKVEEGSGR
jgi:predicted dehydrogenase